MSTLIPPTPFLLVTELLRIIFSPILKFKTDSLLKSRTEWKSVYSSLIVEKSVKYLFDKSS